MITAGTVCPVPGAVLRLIHAAQFLVFCETSLLAAPCRSPSAPGRGPLGLGVAGLHALGRTVVKDRAAKVLQEVVDDTVVLGRDHEMQCVGVGLAI